MDKEREAMSEEEPEADVLPSAPLPVDLSSDLADYILQAYRKIIVLERNPVTGRVIEELLKAEGYNITLVRDKEEALALASAGDYSLLVVSEGLTADGLLLRDELRERQLRIGLRVIRDFGMAILGQEETVAVARARESFYRLAAVFASVLEAQRPGHVGRSEEMASMAVRVCRHIDLRGDEVDGIRVAALFHSFPDLLGVFGQLIAQSGKPEEDLPEVGFLPITILDCLRTAPLRYDMLSIINHMAERFDGKGYPDGLAGERIPLGSRILAPIGVYQEMIHGGLDRKPLRRSNAMEEIKNESGSAFDPRIVESLLDVLREGLLSDEQTEEEGEQILMVGPTPEDELLRLRLRDEGYRTVPVPDAKSAVEALEELKPELIVSDVDLPGSDGFSLLEHLKNNRNTRSIPFVFLASREEFDYVTRGLRLGAEDYLARGTPVDVLFLKLSHLVQRSMRERGRSLQERRGVSGSLRDMALMELIQVLSQGSRTAEVELAREDARCQIYLDDGQIVHAVMGDESGEEAFYRVLAWTDGDFLVRPGGIAPARTINKANDTLFMTGFHRMDEFRRGLKA